MLLLRSLQAGVDDDIHQAEGHASIKKNHRVHIQYEASVANFISPWYLISASQLRMCVPLILFPARDSAISWYSDDLKNIMHLAMERLIKINALINPSSTYAWDTNLALYYVRLRHLKFGNCIMATVYLVDLSVPTRTVPKLLVSTYSINKVSRLSQLALPCSISVNSML